MAKYTIVKEELRPIINYLLVFLILYVGLTYLYEQVYLSHYYQLNPEGFDPLTQLMGKHIADLLDVFGFNASSLNNEFYFGLDVCINSNPQILLVHYCSAVHNQILLVSTIAAYPTKISTRLLFIPGSLVLFYLFNLLRNFSLALVHYQWADHYHVVKPVAAASIHAGFIFVLLLWIGVSLKR